jgi:hypothetical protein
VTKDEFERGYAERSSMTVEELRQHMVPKPCACGDATCLGWRMASIEHDSRIDPVTGIDLDNPEGRT